jgi:Asp/Glu/hydantoin racemase
MGGKADKVGKVGFIHTTPATIGMVEGFMRLYLPLTEFVHMYDGNVKIENFKSPVGITPKMNMLRFANFGEELESAGCDVVVSCCSLMPRATAFAKEVLSVPFIQLDAVILDRAVEGYDRIGVITTTEYVVPYIQEGLKTRAARLGKEIEIVFSGNAAALRLFNAGEYEKHDAIVLDEILRLDARGVGCILLGQIPFALMDTALKNVRTKAPLLYAGETAFRRIEELIGT